LSPLRKVFQRELVFIDIGSTWPFVEKVCAVGAYDSEKNQEFATTNNKELISSGIQGAKGRYELSVDSQNPDNLIVTNTQTGEIIKAQK